MPPGSRPLLAVSMLLLLAAGFLPGCGEPAPAARVNDTTEIGRASCRERV